MEPGQVILLTGGGGIIGRAMTIELTRLGFPVAVVDRDLEAAIGSADNASDGLAAAFPCDVTSLDQLIELRSRVESDMGRVRGLICNAATKSENFFAPYEEFPLEDWEQVMATNLTGPMLCAQVFGAAMAAEGRGSIINVLSIYGIVAPDQRIYDGSQYEGRSINTPAVYSASKAGLWGLTKYLASYWGDAGVRVNAITPGGVFSGQNDAFVEAYSHRTMLGRMARSEEIAAAAAFLVSDGASYITGQNIVVDGGLTTW